MTSNDTKGIAVFLACVGITFILAVNWDYVGYAAGLFCIGAAIWLYCGSAHKYRHHKDEPHEK